MYMLEFYTHTQNSPLALPLTRVLISLYENKLHQVEEDSHPQTEECHLLYRDETISLYVSGALLSGIEKRLLDGCICIK